MALYVAVQARDTAVAEAVPTHEVRPGVGPILGVAVAVVVPKQFLGQYPFAARLAIPQPVNEWAEERMLDHSELGYVTCIGFSRVGSFQYTYEQLGNSVTYIEFFNPVDRETIGITALSQLHGRVLWRRSVPHACRWCWRSGLGNWASCLFLTGTVEQLGNTSE